MSVAGEQFVLLHMNEELVQCQKVQPGFHWKP